MKVLLDTNILIPLEDTRQLLSKNLADIKRVGSEVGVKFYIHPIQEQDINRDKFLQRRKLLLSRIKQYILLPSPPEFSSEEKANLNLKESNSNDKIDNQLLLAIKRHACDILVTHDKGIHKKARQIGIEQNIHYPDQFLESIKKFIGKEPTAPAGIEDRYLYEFDLQNSFFDSLKEGYSEFEDWYSSNSDRKSWAVTVDKELAALCIYKLENRIEITSPLPDTDLSGTTLKLCTFKVSEKHRGKKIGERFLYTAFNYAISKKCKWIYIHMFGKEHEMLVQLCNSFGFQYVGKHKKDDVYCKCMVPPTASPLSLTNLDYSINFFPHYIDSSNVQKFIVPIRPEFHEKLFPDISDISQGLFRNDFQIYPPEANTIRKAYLCHSNTRQIKPGDLVLFYRSKDRKSVEAIGIVEKTFIENSLDRVYPIISKRTVYDKKELTEILTKETLIILFRLLKYTSPIGLKELKECGINRTIQTTSKIEEETYNKIKRRIK